MGLYLPSKVLGCGLRYTRYMSKDPLSSEERQAFIDNLPDDQKNENAAQIFSDAIARAAQPKQSAQEKSTEAGDGYSDTQTHSDTTEDTSR